MGNAEIQPPLHFVEQRKGYHTRKGTEEEGQGKDMLGASCRGNASTNRLQQNQKSGATKVGNF
eukprot:1142820-Pelagomonas_calceolata.AAC.2